MDRVLFCYHLQLKMFLEFYTMDGLETRRLVGVHGHGSFCCQPDALAIVEFHPCSELAPVGAEKNFISVSRSVIWTCLDRMAVAISCVLIHHRDNVG